MFRISTRVEKVSKQYLIIARYLGVALSSLQTSCNSNYEKQDKQFSKFSALFQSHHQAEVKIQSWMADSSLIYVGENTSRSETESKVYKRLVYIAFESLSNVTN